MEAVIKKTSKSIDAVVHLGDGWDEIHDIMLMYPLIPLYAVSGNCDYGSGPSSLAFSFSSKKFLITHGHRYGVKYNYIHISLWAEENEADVCMFGHTHMPEVFYSGQTLLLNPGSIGLPRGNFTASYGIVDVTENGIVEGRIMANRGGEYRRII